MDNIFQLGVSKIRGTPKWMVYGKPLLKRGKFGGTTIFGNIQLVEVHGEVLQPFVSDVHETP